MTLVAALLFAAAFAMGMAGWRVLAVDRAWRQEQEAQDTVIQLLHGDISERDRQIQLQRSLLKAAKQWMLENRPAAPPPN